MARLRTWAAAGLAVVLAGCNADEALAQFCVNNPETCGADAGRVRSDAGPVDAADASIGTDAGRSPRDGGVAVVDAGFGLDAGLAADAGTSPSQDAGQATDAGSTFDAGSGVVDAGVQLNWPTVDAGFATGNAGWAALNVGFEGASVRRFATDPADDTKMYAATNGGLFSTSNSGDSWSEVSALGTRDVFFVGFAPSEPNTVYACALPAPPVTVVAELFVSKDRGASWVRRAGPPDVYSALAFAIDPLNANHLYLSIAGSNAGQILTSFDGGQSWATYQANFTTTALWVGPGPTNVWATTANGLWRSGANGLLQPVTINLPGPFTGLGSTFFAELPDGGLPYIGRTDVGATGEGVYAPYVLPDGGIAWQVIAPRSFAFGVDANGTLYRYDLVYSQLFRSVDQGATWQGLAGVPNQFPTLIQRLFITPHTGVVWASGEVAAYPLHPIWSDGPWRYDGDAAGWSLKTSGMCTNAPILIAADPVQPDHALAVIGFATGAAQQVLSITSNDAGMTVTKITGPPSLTDILAIDPFNALHLEGVDNSGTLWDSTTGGGQAWTIRAPNPGVVKGVLFDPAHPDTEALIVAPYVSVDHLTAKINDLYIPNVATFAFARAGGLRGDVFASSNYAYNMGDPQGYMATLRDGVASIFKGVNCASIAAPSPEWVACATPLGQLQRSTDHGVTWFNDPATPPTKSIDVNEADKVSLWVRPISGGVWLSSGPNTGEDRSIGLPLAGHVGIVSFSQSRSNPDVIYVSTDKRGIYKTTTGGR